MQGKGQTASEEEAGRTSFKGYLLESFGSAVNTQKEKQKSAQKFRVAVLSREHSELAEHQGGDLCANSCLTVIGPELPSGCNVAII